MVRSKTGSVFGLVVSKLLEKAEKRKRKTAAGNRRHQAWWRLDFSGCGVSASIGGEMTCTNKHKQNLMDSQIIKLYLSVILSSSISGLQVV